MPGATTSPTATSTLTTLPAIGARIVSPRALVRRGGRGLGEPLVQRVLDLEHRLARADRRGDPGAPVIEVDEEACDRR